MSRKTTTRSTFSAYSFRSSLSGSSKALPRPNYFPLLPPISPADAKKLSLCRITAKSWNLPKHNYIPVFNFERLSPPTCSVTRGNVHLLTPVIPGGNRKFTDSMDKIIYMLNEDLALILPQSMEEQIQEGRIETLLMSKDERTLEVKLNKRRETLELILYTGENWGSLPEGKGPKKFTNNKHRSRTQDLGQIFRDKETLAELEEKKSLEKIQPNLERVESVKKKLEGSKKPGLPLTLGLRDLEGTYGHLVTGAQGDVVFKPDSPTLEELNENQSISGQFIEAQKRFVPGRLVTPNKFLPGIITGTSKGPKFIAGQVLSTKKGQKFFPGQYYGNQFVPGQIIRQTDGEPRFIPGQVIDTLEAGPTFIPGQIMSVNGHDSFVPGQVIEVNGQPRFVPGKVIEENGTIKFQSGELVDTDEGLKWVQFNLQAWDIDEDVAELEENPRPVTTVTSLSPAEDSSTTNFSYLSLSSVTPSETPNFDSFSTMMESGVLQSLLLAGVEVGDSIVVPSVEIELSEDLHQNRPRLQRSVSVNTFSLFHRVLNSMSDALKDVHVETELDVDHVMHAVKATEGGCEMIKSIVLGAIGEIITESKGSGAELSPEELKRQVLEKVSARDGHGHKIQAVIREESNEDTPAVALFRSYRDIEVKRTQQLRIGKILSKEIDESLYETQLEEISDRLTETVSCGSLSHRVLKVWLKDRKILNQILESQGEILEEQAEDVLSTRIKSIIFATTELNLMELSEFVMLLQEGIQISKILDNDLIHNELKAIIVTNQSKGKNKILENISQGSKMYLQKVALMKQIDKEMELKERFQLSEFLLEFGRGPTELQKVEELVDEMMMWDACVIVKSDLKAVVPKDAASKILAGEARYSVLDDSGIRFFEPSSPRGKHMHKSFLEELQTQAGNGNGGVHITEVTTPDADEFGSTYEESFQSVKSKELVGDYDLDLPVETLLDSSLAKSKLSVKQTGKRRSTSPREQSGHGRRVSIREERDASIRELVETEEEFLKDMDTILKVYYKAAEESTDKTVSESRDIVFGSLPKIAEFHRTLLLEALKSNTDNTKLLGRAFVRLEREFDTHAKYIEEEAAAERYLKENPTIANFYDELCRNVDSSRSLTEQLRLPNQRLNDYSILLQELVEFNGEMDEPTADLEKALELMKSLPQKSGDEKFLKSIEGYRGSIKGLGRLLSHEWFGLTDTTGIRRERYLFLFKGRILVTKVKRITDDRSVFILKDVLRLPDLEVLCDDGKSFDLYEPSTGGKYHLEHGDTEVKAKWLLEVKAYASDPTNRAKRQDSVTVDTAFGTSNSSDEEKSEIKGRREVGTELSKSTSNVVVVRRDSLKSEPEKGPRILIGMKSLACEPGDSAKLHVKFDSTSPCSVSWLKDNKPLADRLADRLKMTSIENDYTMELLNCSDDDSGLYTARCTNAFGSKTSSGILTVHELTAEERAVRMAENSPGFPVKFKDVEVIQDTVACFMIATSGDPLPKLRIYKDGEVLEYDERVKLEATEEPGHYDLFMNHVRPSDAGVYKVVGSNIYGSESFSAKLDVVEEKDVFHGIESGSSEPLDFTWFRDGKNFTPEERFKVMFKDDEDTLALIFQHVTPEDAGLYTCVASTSGGKISCSAELTVKGAVHQLFKEPAPPVIKSKLTRTELNAGGSGMLEIKTEGFPQPTLAWFKDDEEIIPGEKYKFLHEDAESTALIIKNVDLSDAGRYKVIATNELGQDESSADVIVKSSPKFTKEMKDCSALLGSMLVMEISVEGSPTPDFKLYKDGQDLNKNNRVVITKEENTYKIQISNVEKKDAGSYSAVISNSVGQMSCFWSVEINCPPRFISIFEKRVEKEVRETLILELETDEIVKKITWKIDEEIVDSKSKTQNTSSDGSKHRFEWKKLERNSSAKISATISNDYGSIDASSELLMKRKPEITQKLKPVIKNFGETAEFLVKVDSYPKPKVKWFLGDVVVDGKQYTEDGDTLKLKIPKVEASGTVRVKVENDYGYDEDSAELTVKRKPEFTKGLKDVTVLEKEALDLAIDIVGTPMPNLRMFHNGSEVEATARIKITKESTETYHMTFNVVLPSDGGDWMIKASNECGEVESKCKITVEGKPIFEQKLASTIEVIENEDLELTVTLKGSPEPIIKWILNNEELKVSKHIQIVTNGVKSDETISSKLIISKVTMEEAGDLSVVATNKHGSSEACGTIKVISLAELKCPKIVSKLENVKFIKGEHGELKAVVKGNPAPVAEWFKDGESLGPGKQAGEFYSLPLRALSEASAGNYEIVTKNEYGEARSQAQVTVLYKPEIMGLQNLRFFPGELVILTANVTGSPQLSQVDWLKDGVLIKDGGHFSDGIATLKLGPAEKGTTGCYSLRAKNEIGETVAKAEVAVQLDPPVFTKELSSQEVKDGDELILKCKITGTPKPVVNWTKDGEELTEGVSEEDGVYIFKCEEAGATQMGKYKIEAVNLSGVASNEAMVTMAKIGPKFLKGLPRRQSFSEGEPILLKVKVDGSPKPSVAWLKDGKPIAADDRLEIKQLPDGTCTLHISDAKPSDRGNYSVILETPTEKTESSSAIDVHGIRRKPDFLENLAGPSIVPRGKPLKLTAKISGYPLPEIKWLKDGKILKPSSGILSHVEPDGSVSLEILETADSDAGRYKLCLSNDRGDASQEIEVSVGPPLQKPTFSQGLIDTAVVEGFPLELQATVTANPVPQFSVMKDGEPIPLEVKIVSKDGVLKAVLAIPAVTKNSRGMYTLHAVNSEGATKSSCVIDIIPLEDGGEPQEPSFLKELSGVKADEGQEFELMGLVSGNPLPSVEWLRDGIKLGEGTFDGKSVRFRVDNAKTEDGGLYECRLTNDSGTAVSDAPVTIRKIYTKPEFIDRFVDTQQVPARDCKFGAHVTGIPFPTISWFKNGVPISPDDKYGILKDRNLVSLTVRDCSDADKGRYSCVIENVEGKDKCEADLDVVKELPRPPKQEAPSFLKKINTTELYDGMDARFTACITGFPEPEYEWFRDGHKLSPGPRAKFENEGAGLVRLIIPNVTPEDVGTYRLRIFNKHGEATSEGQLKVEGLEIPRRRPPEDYLDYDRLKKSGLPLPLTEKPIISCMSDRHLTLSWKPTLSSTARYPVNYIVEMCEVGGDGSRSDWFTVRRGLRNCVCDVRNLDPWLDYKFRIRVENEYGISDPSPYAITLRSRFDTTLRPWTPVLTHPIPRDYDLDHPPHDGYTHMPRFLNQPFDIQYGIRDSSSKIVWYVYGYPKPTIEFEFIGSNITRDIGGGRWSTTYLNNGEIGLYVNRMTDGVIGNYMAIARNSHGEARQEVMLKLAEHPRFISRPNETWILIRKDGKVTAKVSGNPLPDIKFYKDWTPIGESSRLKFKVIESPDCSYLTITFYLRDSILKDAGLYSFMATNLAGNTHTSFNIRIEESETDYNWGSYGPPKQIKIHSRPFSDYYYLGDELGRGTQGITYHAIERGTGSSFACKSMLGTGYYREWMENEINIMDGLSHRHITRLYDWYAEPSGIRVLMEMSSGGDLISSFVSRTDVREWEISSYIRQLLIGLEYLHDNGIAHLGLSPWDILVTRPNGREIKITDFGLARRIGSKLHPLEYGMPEFVAPEIIFGRGVGFAADIWSVGVITHLLLTGTSLFLGRNDMETLDRIKTGSWNLSEMLSLEARDFLNKILVFEEEGRLDIQSCLTHPWITLKTDTTVDVTTLTTTYYDKLRSWYSNASCRDIYRRRPLSGAYTHQSRMVYPPGEWTPERKTPTRDPRTYQAPEVIYPRPNLDTEIGQVSSESHYQTGPDTYLLQLRDADFPARLRQYMKVAARRSPAMAIQLKGAAYDTDRSVIRERRRFTDIMDEEVDDERKNKINSYGEPRRLRHEVGQHMDIQAEAEALVLSKRDGTVPLFRIRPAFFIGGVMGQELTVTVVVDGDPPPTIQWFKNDLVVGESNRFKTIEDGTQFSLSFTKLLTFDLGAYKVVARNANGQVTARFRIFEAEAAQNTRIPDLNYKVEQEPLRSESSGGDFSAEKEIYCGKFSKIFEDSNGKIVRWSRGFSGEMDLIGSLRNVNLCNPVGLFQQNAVNVTLQGEGGGSLLRVLSNSKYSEQTLCLIIGQILDGISYLHWRGLAILNLEPGNILLTCVDEPVAKLVDFSSLQPVSRLGSRVQTFTPTEFTAPELLSSEPAYPTTDIWNIAVLLYILLSGHSPFAAETEEDTKANVQYVRFRYEYLFKDLTQEVTRFIMLLFKKSPLKRPSIEECLEHRWLLPSEFMLKKREKSCFKAGLLKEYATEYFDKRKEWWTNGRNSK